MKTNTKQIAEFLGIAAVVASLIFVGMQLRLDGRVAMAEQYATRAESTKADARTKMESEEYLAMEAKRWASGIRPVWWSEELAELAEELEFSGTDVMTIYLDRRLAVLQFDILYFQYGQGLLEEDFWNGARDTLKGLLRDPFSRAIFELQAGRLTPVVRELLAEIENEH